MHLISELEVFVGTLLGKSGGVRTRRLREMSMDMKEKFERDVAFTVDCIARGSQEEDGKDEALERSIACLAIAVEEARNTQERVRGKFSVYCCSGVLGGGGEVPKELGVAISALGGPGSCWVRRMRWMTFHTCLTILL